MTNGFLEPYDPPPATSEQNRALRERLIERQDNLCARCGHRPRRGLFELGKYRGRHAAVCRSCGRVLDAPTRIPKANATKRLPLHQRPYHAPAAAPARPVVLAPLRLTPLPTRLAAVAAELRFAPGGSLKGLAKRDHRDFLAWREGAGTRGPVHEGCGGQLTRVRGSAPRLRCAYCKMVGGASKFLPPVPIAPRVFQVVTPDELLRWAQAPFRGQPKKSHILRNMRGPGAEPEPYE